MHKLNVFLIISVLLISTINSPILFSSIALSQEQTTPPSTQTTTTPPTTTTTTTTETQPTTTQSPPEQGPPPTQITSQPSCPSPPQPPACGENQGLSTKFDDKGCVSGYDCKEIPKTEVGQVAVCPDVPASTISCQANEFLNKITDDEGCIVGYNCVSTAEPTAEETSACPAEISEKPECDGSIVPVFDRGCLIYYSCIPKGCRQETDASGFTRVICEQEGVCPADEQQEELKEQCYEQGGNPAPFEDASGCTFYDCRFDNREINTNPFGGHQSCPARDEIDQMFSKCEATGANPRITFEGGCKIVKCSQEEGPVCRHPSESDRTRIENECSTRGFSVARDVDANGCPFYRCGGGVGAQACQRDIPPEAYKKCDSIGGEMIVKNDRSGCIVFSQCVTQGDENDAYVDRVEEIPDTTVLLNLALKLEQLKIELEKLATEAKEISKYYASTGSLDEERYNRVSTMFEGAAKRIGEIKIEIRDNVDDLTTDDLEEIRHDIKYIKEVTLKDILYVMLSNSDDVKETLESSKKVSGKGLSAEELEQNVKGCGTDGFCFDKAIRSCKPVSFQPEGRHGPSMTIKGLEEGKCILHVIMQSEDMVPPGFTKDNFYMDCPIENYALGVRGPEDVIPHCEGPMAKFAKQFGGAAEISGGGDEFQDILEKEGGPGGCKSERECATYCLDNYDECKQWMKEHPSVGPVPSKEELRRYASGEFKEAEEFQRKRVEKQSFGGPGGCKGPQECDKFCRSNPDECMRWCDENPDICPKHEARGEFEEEGYQQRTKPAKVQGKEWYPEFERSTCSECLSDKFTFSGESPTGAVKVEVISGRGNVKLVKGPTAENGFETVVLLDDDEFEGPDFYEIRLFDNTNKEFRFKDCIDGSDYLIIKGNTVQYEHRNFENPGEHTDCELEGKRKKEFERPKFKPEEFVPPKPEGHCYDIKSEKDSVRLISIDPAPGTLLGAGETVEVTAEVGYTLDSHATGSVELWFRLPPKIGGSSGFTYTKIVRGSDTVIVRGEFEVPDMQQTELSVSLEPPKAAVYTAGYECWSSMAREPIGTYPIKRTSVPAVGPSPATVSGAPESVQACVGCLNNGLCDIGECSECSDCLKGGRTITGEIARAR